MTLASYPGTSVFRVWAWERGYSDTALISDIVLVKSYNMTVHLVIFERLLSSPLVIT